MNRNKPWALRALALLLLLCLGLATALAGCRAAQATQRTAADPAQPAIPNAYVQTQADVYPLDRDYQRALNDAQSTVDLMTTHEAFADRWRECAQQYYALLRDATDSADELAALEEDQQQWENTMQGKIDRMVTLLQSKHAYDSGSIVKVLIAQYRYHLYRERALTLYGLCLDFHLFSEK